MGSRAMRAGRAWGWAERRLPCLCTCSPVVRRKNMSLGPHHKLFLDTAGCHMWLGWPHQVSSKAGATVLALLNPGQAFKMGMEPAGYCKQTHLTLPYVPCRYWD